MISQKLAHIGGMPIMVCLDREGRVQARHVFTADRIDLSEDDAELLEYVQASTIRSTLIHWLASHFEKGDLVLHDLELLDRDAIADALYEALDRQNIGFLK